MLDADEATNLPAELTQPTHWPSATPDGNRPDEPRNPPLAVTNVNYAKPVEVDGK